MTRHVHDGYVKFLGVWNMSSHEVLFHISYEILEFLSIPNAAKELRCWDFDIVGASLSRV